jgi:hypothetical protein
MAASDIYCVEALAIYEEWGAPFTNQRRNQRDTDFADAVAQGDAVSRAVAPQSNEYSETFESPSRYGSGWRIRIWIVTNADAITIGQAIWTRLLTRNMKNGTIVTVFPRDTSLPTYMPGPIVYQRALPAGQMDIG